VRNSPNKLTVPTIARLIAIADLGGIPMTYTRVGTVKIEPPPPIKPRLMPMATANI
jgi:hypothetical protein